MTMGQDIPHDSGPTWIYSHLKYQQQTDDSGQVVELVSAPCLVEPDPFWLKPACCKHYCKLLSPAYALEWIYIDGLRYRLADNSTASMQ